MLVACYDAFVQATDQSAKRPQQERLDIATYGLASEVGSVVAAIKKRLLGEGGEGRPLAADAEIAEELGDVVWYLFALAHAQNPDQPFNVFGHDIASLRAEIGAGDARAERIRGILGPSKRNEFLQAAAGFAHLGDQMRFEDYQELAFLTARTQDRTLVEVCLAVLWQLSAELLRRKLPPFERELNKGVVDRDPNQVLGEIAWHVAALASVQGLRLSDIAFQNTEKVRFRFNRDNPTPLHDATSTPGERFPRRFEVGFVTVSPGRARMYLNGRRLGDDLTDNAYSDDGYRFHDVVHLACVAKLGWSPVIRKLMGRKRKSDPKKDEVEDGARAQIVEEAVIKAIHSEGVRLAGVSEEAARRDALRLFPNRSDITFRFLKLINSFVTGLEVHRNRFWEWEDAIFEGYALYDRLRHEGQGTVSLDLDARTITFGPAVAIDLKGRVVGLGSACVGDSPVTEGKAEGSASTADYPRKTAQKFAILNALGLVPSDDFLLALDVNELPCGNISVKAIGEVQEVMWERQVICFRTTVAASSAGAIYCTALALTDD
jgi:NTP pyrophosphatase (non-canonical NTP hydrolase)